MEDKIAFTKITSPEEWSSAQPISEGAPTDEHNIKPSEKYQQAIDPKCRPNKPKFQSADSSFLTIPHRELLLQPNRGLSGHQLLL